MFLHRNQGGLCARCALPLLPTERWHIDHYLPLSRGGQDTLTNLRLMHASCNLAKGDSLP